MSQYHAIQSLRLTVGHPRQKNRNSTIESIDLSEPTNHYGYLEHIQSYKSLCNVNDKTLPRNVRKFYEKQLRLITLIESILVPRTQEEKQERIQRDTLQQKQIRILIIITLIINIILVLIKITGAIISTSLSVISSVVNSILDIRTNLTLIWASRQIKKHNFDKYPAGRTRLQTISIIMLSVIMCTASVQIIIESSQRLTQDIKYFQHQNENSSKYSLHDIDMTPIPIVSMVLSIVSKGILYIVSYRNEHPSIRILNVDDRNDVLSGIVALSCGLIASKAIDGKIKQQAVVIDPIGAIIISIFILIAWGVHARRHIQYLTGLTANPFVLQRITHIVYNYRPDMVKKLDFIQVVHYGMNYFVDVDIALSQSIPLSIAHDIGLELQNQLETIDDIERAYVHLTKYV